MNDKYMAAFPKVGNIAPSGAIGLSREAMKVISLIHFLLLTYVPIHFFVVGGAFVVFLQVGGKNKKFGNH